MTLNSVKAVILRFSTEFSSFIIWGELRQSGWRYYTHTICDKNVRLVQRM